MEVIEKATSKDISELLNMSADLWPDYSRDEMDELFRDILVSDKFNVLLCHIDDECCGFIYMGIRTDYVEGADSSPTGFVEGIYVKPAYRKQGVARKLLQAGEQWVMAKGCTQVGSDIYLDNTVSYDFHTRSGFREAGRLIAFIKDL